MNEVASPETFIAEHGLIEIPCSAPVKWPGHTDDLTEDGFARRFAKEYAGRFVYDHTAQHYRRFENGRWDLDQRARCYHAVRDYIKAERDKVDNPPASWGKIAFASAVERAVRTDPLIAVSHEVWNADGDLLGVPGGAIDLHTGNMLRAEPHHYISRQTSVAPAPAGTPAPLWSAFLAAATRNDEAMQRFLQRLAGYVVTGDVSEEVLTFLYGPGGNGKGVFLGTITAILADYAVAVPTEVFTAGSRLNLEYYRAQMAGARLVTASETEAGASWAESQIKEMTGNEAPLSARHPYGQPFTFRPQFKIVLVGNHAPKLKGRSAAMERRLRVVPFTHSPDNPDPFLKDKLKAEYSAILRWMIDGCLAWQRERLGTCPAVAAATSAYFEQQDAFRRWLDERCILDPVLRSRPGQLFTNYTAWARENGEDPLSNVEFAELIDRTPELTRAKVKGVPWVKGVGFKAQGGEGG